MPRSSLSTDAREDDAGSASLEFILVGMLLLVPLVYLVVTLGLIQGQALGVEAGARHAARAIATASDADDARARAERVLRSVVHEYGVDREAVDIDIACPSGTASCPESGATIVVTVRTRVSLPLVPPVLGLERLASIPIEASAVQKVSRTWGSR
jgi:Flp pilus assembly protein TadG